MRTRLLRLTALSIGVLAFAGDLPRDGSFTAGLSWISAAHADDTNTGGGNGEGAPGGGDQGGENVGSGGTEGGGDGSGGNWGSGDGSGAGPEPGLEPGGTGAGGGGAAVIDRNSHSEPHSSIRDSRDYGPGGSTWHGGSSFLNLFRQTPQRRGEGSQPQSSARQKTVHTN